MKKLITTIALLLITVTVAAQKTYNYDVIVGKNVGLEAEKTTVSPVILRYNVDDIDLSVEVKEHNIFSKYNIIKPTYEEKVEGGLRYITFKMINLDTGAGAIFIITEKGVFGIIEGDSIVTFYTFDMYEQFKKI